MDTGCRGILGDEDDAPVDDIAQGHLQVLEIVQERIGPQVPAPPRQAEIDTGLVCQQVLRLEGIEAAVGRELGGHATALEARGNAAVVKHAVGRLVLQPEAPGGLVPGAARRRHCRVIELAAARVADSAFLAAESQAAGQAPVLAQRPRRLAEQRVGAAARGRTVVVQRLRREQLQAKVGQRLDIEPVHAE